MKTGLSILFILIGISSAFADSGYRLGAGDKISVVVYNEKDMSLPSLRVPKQGKITFPYIGEIKVSGLTTRQLKKVLVKRLKDGYLRQPELNINIEEYRPFYVNGEVNSPGGYPYVEGLTIRKAIALAGGLTERASLKKIGLVSEGKKRSKRINKSLDEIVNPGDILTIGEALF